MVLDGNSIVNRAFYGVRPLSTKDGTPTNAVFGFLNILTKLLAEEDPEALCVTFDLKAPTFRHEQYEGYKAQRKGMPDELAAQMPILKDVLDAMCIPRYELSGFEADDLIGTISAKCEGTGVGLRNRHRRQRQLSAHYGQNLCQARKVPHGTDRDQDVHAGCFYRGIRL